MKLKVKIEDSTFDINGGNGLNDFVWLSLAAAKLYGKSRYPNGNYIPICLKIGSIPIHPRTKICDYFKNQEDLEDLGEISVEIQHPTTIWNSEHQQWFDRAFGKDRNILLYKFMWYPDKVQVEKDRLKGIIYKARISYKMFPELIYEFNALDYKPQYDLPLLLNEFQGLAEYSAEIYLPFGDIAPHSILCFIPNKENKDEEIKPKIIPISQEANKIKNEKNPMPVSQIEMSKKIRDSIKIAEELAQQMDLKEDDKPEKFLSGLCPFTFETLWNVIENNQDSNKNMNLDSLDENLKEDVSKIFADKLNKIFEIFFQYTFLYEQPNEKKDELVITIQDLMHFLKFYQVCPDSQSLFQFIEYYDVEKKRTKNLKATLSIANGVKFPEFIVIILKAANFLQTVNLMSENESFNDILKALVNKMLKIDSNDEETNEFQRHMKYNMTLVNYLRENSEKLMNIFMNKLHDSIQIAERKYHMLREEIKSIINESGFKGENLEEILNSCYHELQFENYQGFEGVFYHEFLQSLQWLSLVLVSDESEVLEVEEEKKEKEEDGEEGVEVLIEKMKYLLNQLKEME